MVAEEAHTGAGRAGRVGSSKDAAVARPVWVPSVTVTLVSRFLWLELKQVTAVEEIHTDDAGRADSSEDAAVADKDSIPAAVVAAFRTDARTRSRRTLAVGQGAEDLQVKH